MMPLHPRNGSEGRKGEPSSERPRSHLRERIPRVASVRSLAAPGGLAGRASQPPRSSRLRRIRRPPSHRRRSGPGRSEARELSLRGLTSSLSPRLLPPIRETPASSSGGLRVSGKALMPNLARSATRPRRTIPDGSSQAEWFCLIETIRDLPMAGPLSARRIKHHGFARSPGVSISRSVAPSGSSARHAATGIVWVVRVSKTRRRRR